MKICQIVQTLLERTFVLVWYAAINGYWQK